MEKNILTSLGPSHQYLQNMYNIMYVSLELQIQALMIFNLFHICPVFCICSHYVKFGRIFMKFLTRVTIIQALEVSMIFPSLRGDL